MTKILERVIVVGGTSSIAQHCVREWLKSSSLDLILIVRDTAKAKIVAADLQMRSPKSCINIHEVDFNSPLLIGELVELICQHGSIDKVLIAQGVLFDQILCQNDLTICYESLMITGISPILFAEAFVKRMESFNKGTLIIIGSVAGDRGRKSNYIYGTAKGMLERFVEGLQHRLVNTKIKIILVKPGPTLTPMITSLNLSKFKPAAVEKVARSIVRQISKNKGTIYAPQIWKWLMYAIKILPNYIFNKLNL